MVHCPLSQLSTSIDRTITHMALVEDPATGGYQLTVYLAPAGEGHTQPDNAAAAAAGEAADAAAAAAAAGNGAAASPADLQRSGFSPLAATTQVATARPSLPASLGPTPDSVPGQWTRFNSQAEALAAPQGFAGDGRTAALADTKQRQQQQQYDAPPWEGTVSDIRAGGTPREATPSSSGNAGTNSNQNLLRVPNQHLTSSSSSSTRSTTHAQECAEAAAADNALPTPTGGPHGSGAAAAAAASGAERSAVLSAHCCLPDATQPLEMEHQLLQLVKQELRSCLTPDECYSLSRRVRGCFDRYRPKATETDPSGQSQQLQLQNLQNLYVYVQAAAETGSVAAVLSELEALIGAAG